jgi:hydroxymethylbilane synthase
MAAPALRIGTRASLLARWQADWVAARLCEFGAKVEIVLLSTRGDREQGEPIGQLGGQGLFTKEIQAALLEGRADVAVHSLKDLPTDPVADLVVAAVPPRGPNGDVLVSPKYPSVAELPQGAVVGTGSARRRAQLLGVRPDLQMAEVRGNVDTRLKKLDAGDYDALVLAEAGLVRLGLADRIRQALPKALMLPAVGQGALGIECRADDAPTRGWLERLDDPATRAAVTAERAMLAALRGGCLAPVGAWGRVEAGQLLLAGVVLRADGSERLFAERAGELDATESLGRAVADELLAAGAAALIDSARQH